MYNSHYTFHSLFHLLREDAAGVGKEGGEIGARHVVALVQQSERIGDDRDAAVAATARPTLNRRLEPSVP